MSDYVGKYEGRELSLLDTQERGWAASNHQIHRDNCPMCMEAEGEAERLRADLERLARETMGITAAGAKAYEEAAWLRTNMNAIDALKASKNYPDDILEAVWLISDSALAVPEADDEQWIADAESGKDREVPGNYRYKVAVTEDNVDRLTEVIEREEDWEDGFDE
jgi:hypothetical protein